ncbi:MAG: cardiolipin synthase [Rhodocyclales bacterium]|nr:cardiolipin synthase [Rhodocyclales bacterium]
MSERDWPLIRSRNGWLSEKQSLSALRRAGGGNSQSEVSANHQFGEEQVSGSSLVAGNEVSLLSDGPDTYGAMLEAIHRARKLILLESYILDNDAVGTRFAEALTERSKAGVTVAVMVDAVGTLSTPNAYFDALQQAGIIVVHFNPIDPLRSWFGWTLDERDHRKVLVVDGKVGFTGGLNLSEVYSSRPGRSGARRKELAGENAPWRDTHVRIRGPAAMDLQREFLRGWAEQGGPPLLAAATVVAANQADAGTMPGRDLVRIVATSPDEGSAIYWTLLGAINRAQHSVHITMAYFVPNREFLDALEDASNRGVDVELVLPGFSDFWMVFHAGRAHYTELLKSKVRIYERRDALLHAKTAVIDGIWSTVGSSNIDWRSFVHNHELNAIVLGPSFGAQMEAQFDKDRSASVPVMLNEWNQRSWTFVLRERAALLFSYWL